MPKVLKEDVPSSSIKRLLRPESAARALAPAAGNTAPVPEEPAPPVVELAPAPRPRLEPIAPPAPTPKAVETGERPNIKRELTLTRGADKTLSDLVSLFQDVTATKVSASHVVRSLMIVIRENLDTIEAAAAASIGPTRLPSNWPGAEAAREQFERQIADAIRTGITAGQFGGPPRRSS